MRVLVADDERVSRRMLETILTEWGYEVVLACDGASAWQILQQPDAPSLGIVDWLMPGMDGLEVCRRARLLGSRQPPHLILLTVKGTRQDIVTGLQAGAADYIAKPFDLPELQARLRIGQSIVELREALAAQVRERDAALAQVKQLQGLLPICCYCKDIRSGGDYWASVEEYLSRHTDAQFSHGICPDCWEKVVVPEMQKIGIVVPAMPPVARATAKKF